MHRSLIPTVQVQGLKGAVEAVGLTTMPTANSAPKTLSLKPICHIRFAILLKRNHLGPHQESRGMCAQASQTSEKGAQEAEAPTYKYQTHFSSTT